MCRLPLGNSVGAVCCRQQKEVSPKRTDSLHNSLSVSRSIRAGLNSFSTAKDNVLRGDTAFFVR